MVDAPRPFYPTLIPVAGELWGPRVTLRQHSAADTEAMFAALEASRARLDPWLRFHTFIRTPEDARDFLIHREADWLLRTVLGYAIWGAESGNDAGVYLGHVELHHIDWDMRAFDLGYWLRAGAEGRGYMSEAVGLVTSYVFSGLEGRKVNIRCEARNWRSASVAERLGFTREARLRQETRGKDGELVDEWYYARLRGDPVEPAAGSSRETPPMTCS